MKSNRAKITLALLLFQLAFCTFALLNTRHIGRQMEVLVSEVKNGPVDAQAIDRIETAWQKRESVLDLYSRHDEVERISLGVEKLRPLYDTAQYDDLKVSLDEIVAALEHLMHTETPTISNIL